MTMTKLKNSAENGNLNENLLSKLSAKNEIFGPLLRSHPCKKISKLFEKLVFFLPLKDGGKWMDNTIFEFMVFSRLMRNLDEIQADTEASDDEFARIIAQLEEKISGICMLRSLDIVQYMKGQNCTSFADEDKLIFDLRRAFLELAAFQIENGYDIKNALKNLP